MNKVSMNFDVYFFYKLTGAVVFLIGFIFYLFWGIEYKDWGDSGLISFVVPVMLLGLLGIWLGIEKEKESRKIVKK